MSGLHTPSKADREAFAQRIEGLVGKHGQPAFERVMLDQILTTAENVHVTIFDRTMRANLHTPPTGRGEKFAKVLANKQQLQIKGFRRGVRGGLIFCLEPLGDNKMALTRSTPPYQSIGVEITGYDMLGIVPHAEVIIRDIAALLEAKSWSDFRPAGAKKDWLDMTNTEGFGTW